MYEGYFIPKGTNIVPNVWYVLRCTYWKAGLAELRLRQIAFSPNAKYPPEEFIPERFLDDEVYTMDPSLWAFGFGRRCVACFHSPQPRLI